MSRSGQIKDYIIGVYCLFTKHAALNGKIENRLARNLKIVSDYSDMSTRGLMFKVKVMVFTATFNNISVISWRCVVGRGN